MAKDTLNKQTSSETQKTFEKELNAQFYDIVKKVVLSEKATRLTEFENKLVFEVDRLATKSMIKLLIENEFKKKVKSVNTVNNINGKKNAIVTFKDEGTASDLSSELGLV